MKYRNFVLIEYQGQKKLEQGFDDFIDNGDYIVIDKEEYARDILDKIDKKNTSKMDLYEIVDNELTQISSDIVELIMEMWCNE